MDSATAWSTWDWFWDLEMSCIAIGFEIRPWPWCRYRLPAVTLSICRHALPIRVLPLAKITPHSPITVNRSGQDIVYAFISSRLDYCNSLLFGVPGVLLLKVQSVQNAAARLVTGAKRRDHITPVLQQLHWLLVQRRIEFKIACLMHQSSGRTPMYLAADIQLTNRGRQNLRSPVTGHASYHRPTTLSVIGVFLSLDFVCGTVCLQTYDLRCNSGHSGDNSKQYCLVNRDHGA